jgi:tetratricopeptide (TPR) repeat protein
MMMFYIFAVYNILRDYEDFGRVVILVAIGLCIYSIDEFIAIDSPSQYKGLMANKNQCAAVMVMLTFLCAHYYRKWKSASVVAILMCLFVIFTIRGRASLLALTAASLFALVKWVHLHKKKKLALLIVMLVVLLCTCFITTNDIEKARKNKLFNTTSLKQRLDLWKISLLMVRDFPNGVGAGNWKLIYLGYAASMKPETRQLIYNKTFYARAHNDFVQILAEIGYVGFISYLAIFLLTLWYARGWIQTGILAYMILAFWTFPMTRPCISMILMVFMAIALLQKRKPLRIKRSYIFNPLILIVLLACLGNFYARYEASRYGIIAKKAVAMKNYDRAMEIYKENSFLTSVSISGTPVDLFLGMTYIGKNDFKSAIACLEKAVKVAPYHLYANIELGKCYAREKRYVDAFKCFRNMQRVYPDSVEVQQNIEVICKATNSGRNIYLRG